MSDLRLRARLLAIGLWESASGLGVILLLSGIFIWHAYRASTQDFPDANHGPVFGELLVPRVTHWNDGASMYQRVRLDSGEEISFPADQISRDAIGDRVELRRRPTGDGWQISRVVVNAGGASGDADEAADR